jgi:hypothetical protein
MSQAPWNPPPYASESYWEQKYLNSPQPFDWLLPARVLIERISNHLNSYPGGSNILHIGCGQSDLSFALRKAISDPSRTIDNADFSATAIEWGRQQEKRIGSIGPMRWIYASLLSFSSVCAAFERPYAIIVDKSTCDSIACGDNVEINTPFPLAIRDETLAAGTHPGHPRKDQASTGAMLSIHPLLVLAAHLAFLTDSGGKWIALSFSPERFHFLHGEPDEESDDLETLLEHGFPDVRQLWELEETIQIDTEERHKNDSPVHRPKILYYLYIVRRTEVELHVR